MQGLGQFDAAFSSPDFPGLGAEAQASVAGADEESPFVAGPSVGGFPDTSETGGGPVHMATGANAPNPMTTVSHWSNLFDWKHGVLFWLLLATLIYLGLISLHVSYKVGRR